MSERTLTLEEIKQVELDILKYLHDLVNNIKSNTLLILEPYQELYAIKDLSLGMMNTDISLARDEFEKLYKIYKMKIIPTTN